MSASGAASTPGDSAGALAAMSTALLAQQLPPLSKFDGDPGVGDNRETIKEWLEQFELVAGVCRWDNQAKLNCEPGDKVEGASLLLLQVMWGSRTWQL